MSVEDLTGCPGVAPAVGLRRAADVVVAAPAEALRRLAVCRRQHAAERSEVAGAFQLEELEQQIRLAAGRASRDRLRRAQAGTAQRLQAVGLGGKGVGEACVI